MTIRVEQARGCTVVWVGAGTDARMLSLVTHTLAGMVTSIPGPVVVDLTSADQSPGIEVDQLVGHALEIVAAAANERCAIVAPGADVRGELERRWVADLCVFATLDDALAGVPREARAPAPARSRRRRDDGERLAS